jgi:nitrous oxidase accessory protein
MLKENGNKNISLLIILFLIFFQSVIFSKTIQVGSNHKVKTISSALLLAADGDTLLIAPGIYNEGPITINKSVTIIGNNNPVISGDGKYEIFLVKADNVNITRLIFRDAGLNYIKDNAAIKLDNVKNCVISFNKFENNFFGIYLAKSQHCLIEGNILSANQKKETQSGNGIHLWYCKNIIIKHNTIRGHRDGIYMEFVRRSNIHGNFAEKNIRYGLHFMFSDSCSYSNNHFQINGAGAAVMYSHNVEMKNNRFEKNWGGASYGLLLKDIYDSNIINNIFYKNSCGIYLEGCNRNTSSKNDLIENGWAVRLMANSMDNKFSENNFISNTFDIATNSTKNYNNFDGNYWSEYNGYDLNKDGIGDVPYRPVKLFSFISERIRPSLILIRSFFIEIVNIAETVFPTFTPEALLDINPKMKRI